VHNNAVFITKNYCINDKLISEIKKYRKVIFNFASNAVVLIKEIRCLSIYRYITDFDDIVTNLPKKLKVIHFVDNKMYGKTKRNHDDKQIFLKTKIYM